VWPGAIHFIFFWGGQTWNIGVSVRTEPQRGTEHHRVLDQQRGAYIRFMGHFGVGFFDAFLVADLVIAMLHNNDNQ
jgi:hypothetical protein